MKDRRIANLASSVSALGCLLLFVASVSAQKDPCSSVKVELANGDPPTYTLAQISKQPKCFDATFVEILGIYRVSFENSDLYDPDEPSARAWVSFDRYFAAVKRCGAPGGWKALDRKYGGTWGFKAYGIIQTTGHNGWPMEFQVICIEKAPLLNKAGMVLDASRPDEKKIILDWYKSEIKKLY